jgi:hypothetical protein
MLRRISSSAGGGIDASAVQTACEAAIAGAGLATAASVAGVPAAVDAVISDEAIASSVADVQTDVDAVLARFPDLLVAEVTSVAAAGSSQVVAASPGQQIAVFGWNASAEAANGGGSLGFFSGDPLGAGVPVRSGAFAAGGQWEQEVVQDQVVFSTATGDPLFFANDGIDPVTVRVYYRLVTP